jgi:hypothetical protein
MSHEGFPDSYVVAQGKSMYQILSVAGKSRFVVGLRLGLGHKKRQLCGITTTVFYNGKSCGYTICFNRNASKKS